MPAKMNLFPSAFLYGARCGTWIMVPFRALRGKAPPSMEVIFASPRFFFFSDKRRWRLIPQSHCLPFVPQSEMTADCQAPCRGREAYEPVHADIARAFSSGLFPLDTLTKARSWPNPPSGRNSPFMNDLSSTFQSVFLSRRCLQLTTSGQESLAKTLLPKHPVLGSRQDCRCALTHD